MELTELQNAWRQLDTRLAGLETQAREQRLHRRLDALRSRIRLLGLGQWVQLLAGAALVVTVAPWWIEHWGQWHLVAYGIGLHAYGLLLLITAVVQLLAIAILDYREPVAKVQKRLLLVRRVRIWGQRWGLVAGFTAWVPAVFAGLATFGWDVWLARPGVVLINLAAGLVMSAAVAWLSYRCRAWFEREAVGGSLRTAQQELAGLEGASEPATTD
jgi:hypothetical protein